MRWTGALGTMLLAGQAFLSGCTSSDAAPLRDAGRSDGRLDARGNLDGSHRQDSKRHVDASAEDGRFGDAFVADEPVICDPVDAGSTFGSSACNACLASACCQQVSLCLAAVDGGPGPCARLAGCVAACDRDAGSEASCETACSEQYPLGIGLAENVNDCLSLQCTGDAGGNACGDL